MRYRIACPVREGVDGDPRFDIVDPVSSAAQRALAEGGFADTEVATNAVLLTLCERAAGRFTLVDVGAEVGVASMLCAAVFKAGRIIAIEQSQSNVVMIDRIAAANELEVERRADVADVARLAADEPGLVVRIGPSADVATVVDALAEVGRDERPPIVIVGDRDDPLATDELIAIVADTEYVLYPLARYPSWRSVTPTWSAPASDGWLLFAEGWTRALRRRHQVWAGALGACTPDRNDRRPFLAETRGAIRDGRTNASLATSMRRDVRAEARYVWSLVDPLLPPPRTRIGRALDRLKAQARARL